MGTVSSQPAFYLQLAAGSNLDGMENPDKEPEIERRKRKREEAESAGNFIGQIKNSPEYIAKAVEVCKYYNIQVIVSAYEADPQVSHLSLSQSLVPVTGDSDLLAYGVPEKIIIVKGYHSQIYRIIDLSKDNINEGDYPLLDLYHKHGGKIVFKLYAAVVGCDFTDLPNDIDGIGFETFIKLAGKVE